MSQNGNGIRTVWIPDSYKRDQCPRRQALAGMEVTGFLSDPENMARTFFVDTQAHLGPDIVGTAVFSARALGLK